MTPVVLIAAAVLVVGLLIMVVAGRRTRPPVAPVPVEELDAGTRRSIDESLARGEVVRAIKLYREAVPTSLLDAKNTVEAYARRGGES